MWILSWCIIAATFQSLYREILDFTEEKLFTYIAQIYHQNQSSAFLEYQ